METMHKKRFYTWLNCKPLFVILLMLCVSSNAILNSAMKLCDNQLCQCGYDTVICECSKDVQTLTMNCDTLEKSGVSNITVHNCHTVIFPKRSIKEIRSLRNLNIHNVRDLRLEESAFEWDYITLPSRLELPKLSIRIQDTTTLQLSNYCFKGGIKEIALLNVHVKMISAFAFSSLHGTRSIVLKDSIIDNIQIQGFKKFSTEAFLLINTTFKGTITGRAFSDIEVTKLFRISNGCKFDTLRPSAMMINNPINTEILDSTFNVLNGEAFKIVVLGNVLFRNNVFNDVHMGAFSSIALDKRVLNGIGRSDMTFSNNTVISFRENSLNFNTSSFNVKFFNLKLNTTCSCENITNWEKLLKEVDLKQIQCYVKKSKYYYVLSTAEEFKSASCNVKAKVLQTFVIIITVLVIIAAVATVFILYYCRRRDNNNQKEWINNASPILARKNRESNISTGNGKVPMIVPDGRTYRETELHVVFEKAELLTTEL